MHAAGKCIIIDYLDFFFFVLQILMLIWAEARLCWRPLGQRSFAAVKKRGKYSSSIIWIAVALMPRPNCYLDRRSPKIKLQPQRRCQKYASGENVYYYDSDLDISGENSSFFWRRKARGSSRLPFCLFTSRHIFNTGRGSIIALYCVDLPRGRRGRCFSREDSPSFSTT